MNRVSKLRAAARQRRGGSGMFRRKWTPLEGSSNAERAALDGEDETVVLARRAHAHRHHGHEDPHDHEDPQNQDGPQDDDDPENTVSFARPTGDVHPGHAGRNPLAGSHAGETLVPNPELAERARRRVGLTRIGVAAALVGAVLMVVASVLRVDPQQDRLWSTAANVAAVLVLMLGVLQWRVWVSAWLEWRGVRAANLSPWLGMSILGGWLSVVMVLVEAFAGWRATLSPAAGDLATLLTWFALVASVAGVVLAGLRSFSPGSAPWQGGA